jgi:hypothetical protein
MSYAYYDFDSACETWEYMSWEAHKPDVTGSSKSTLTLLQVKSLAEKARTGKLKPHEFQGGTFRSVN